MDIKKWKFGKLYVAAMLLGYSWCGWGAPAAAQSIQVHDVPLAEVVRGIAKSEGLQVVGTETLQGNISASLQGNSAAELLHKLAGLYHFGLRTQEGVFILSAGGENQKGEGTLCLTPQQVRADKLAELLKAVLPDGQVKVVKETNQVVVFGTQAQRAQAQAILEATDKAPQQVRLAVMVVALEESAVRELGLRWSWGSVMGTGQSNTAEHRDYGAIQFGRTPEGESYKFFYQPQLSAMENAGKALIIARPNLTTVSGEEAQILIGDRVPVLSETKENGSTTQNIRYEDAGISLRCTPYSVGDSYIDAVVRAEVSNPVLVSELKAYKFTTRQAQTRVRLRDGEALLIGGLMDLRRESLRQKVPLLGDLPILGKLFRYSRQAKEGVELFILVRAERIRES